MFPLDTSTSAPSASKPLICWSIGLGPKLHPPGSPTSARPQRPSKAPIK